MGAGEGGIGGVRLGHGLGKGGIGASALRFVLCPSEMVLDRIQRIVAGERRRESERENA